MNREIRPLDPDLLKQIAEGARAMTSSVRHRAIVEKIREGIHRWQWLMKVPRRMEGVKAKRIAPLEVRCLLRRVRPRKNGHGDPQTLSNNRPDVTLDFVEGSSD